MVKELLIYPDERIRHISADVRSFDEELYALIENMKDTMRAHDAQALSAIQIAVPAAVVLYVEDDGSITELINPRIILSTGQQESVETALYMPGFSCTLPRYDEIKLIYQDRFGEQKSMDVKGKKSALIQRKIDYTFGGTLLDKMDKKARKKALKYLKNNLR